MNINELLDCYRQYYIDNNSHEIKKYTGHRSTASGYIATDISTHEYRDVLTDEEVDAVNCALKYTDHNELIIKHYRQLKPRARILFEMRITNKIYNKYMRLAKLDLTKNIKNGIRGYKKIL